MFRRKDEQHLQIQVLALGEGRAKDYKQPEDILIFYLFLIGDTILILYYTISFFDLKSAPSYSIKRKIFTIPTRSN